MTTRIRTLVADDEPIARARMLALLRDEPDIELIGECASGREAIATVQKESPDLLFLDIQMPEVDGFEVLHGIRQEHMPIVIFISPCMDVLFLNLDLSLSVNQSADLRGTRRNGCVLRDPPFAHPPTRQESAGGNLKCLANLLVGL